MKSFTLKALAVIACLTLSQTALARQVAVCTKEYAGAHPTDTIECRIGNDENPKKTTLFEMIKAGWSIQAVTLTQHKQEKVGNDFYFDYYTDIYLEKP